VNGRNPRIQSNVIDSHGLGPSVVRVERRMPLMTGAARGTSGSQHSLLERVRDVGLSLEYAVVRYERLAREVAAGAPLAEDLHSRVQVVNRDLAALATAMQDLVLLVHQARVVRKRSKPVAPPKSCLMPIVRRAAPEAAVAV
jgi:hypothetical protein